MTPTPTMTRIGAPTWSQIRGVLHAWGITDEALATMPEKDWADYHASARQAIKRRGEKPSHAPEDVIGTVADRMTLDAARKIAADLDIDPANPPLVRKGQGSFIEDWMP